MRTSIREVIRIRVINSTATLIFIMNSLIPTFILFVLLVASIATTIVIFNSSLDSLRLTYQEDIAKVNENVHTVQSAQSSFNQQVTTLKKLLTESLNATDEYFSNFTDTVSEAKESINQDMATVQDIKQNQSEWMAVQFAGMFTVLVILVSGYHVSQHLRYMHLPVVQRKIMAVLWMTPIYSISSWLSLVFVNAEPYLAVIREFYESYCVYMFLSFLIAVLGRGDRRAVVTMLELKADELSKPDACCCGPSSCKRYWLSCRKGCEKRRNNISKSDPDSSGQKMTRNNPIPPPGAPTSRDEYGCYITADRMKAEAVLDQCQMYAMQFVLLRPVTAIGWLVSNQLVEPKKFLDPTTPQLYIAIVTNISIFFAFRGLVRFYHATRSNLEWCNPWPKFLMIKGVVFMTFWQKMVLGLVVNLGYSDKFDSQEAANDFVVQAQNFLICLEMLFSAVAHCFVFTPDEWADGYREREEQRQVRTTTLGDSVALGDFINDVKIVMSSKKRRRKLKQMQKRGISPASSWDDETGDLNLSLSSRSSGGEYEDGDDYQRSSIKMTRSDESGELAEYEINGSLVRIEKFIDEHTINSDDRNEVV